MTDTARPLWRQAAAWVGHRWREAELWPQILRSGSPKVIYFPSQGRSGASLLRAFAVAEALQPLGWSAIAAPPQLEMVQRRRIVQQFRPDLVIFQTCRHPLNDPAAWPASRLVLDLDDADFHDPAMAHRLESTARVAAGIIAGSRYIANWARQFNPNVTVIWTGTPISPGHRPQHQIRPAVIAWAQSAPLGYRAECMFVRDLCQRLRSRGVVFQLRLYGVDNDMQAAELRQLFTGVELDLRGFLPYEDFLVSLRDVAIGLSPIMATEPFSRGKSFGKILGYLDAGVPVITSDEADHALFFKPSTGIVTNDAATWEDVCVQLLADPDKRQAMADAATVELKTRLTVGAAAELSDRYLRGLIDRPRDRLLNSRG